jgi:hypothetical protein
MLNSRRNTRSCTWGCCDGGDRKSRTARTREKRAWRKAWRKE